jgi:capsular polysaccharide export protein
VHPFEGKGARRGHLRSLARARAVEVYDADVSWMSVARRAGRVYVASSHAGLEALIAGAPVTCFGVPFYAGWGLTDDRQRCPRRAARPPLEAVIAAAYLRYTRYLSPLSGQPCSALQIARLLAARRRRDRETAGRVHILGVHPWKHVQVRPFVEGRRTCASWTMSPDEALRRQATAGGRIVVWASREPPDFAVRCEAQGADLIRVEDGFLRSVGLGANLELPASLVLDRSGIYYDPTASSDLERLLQSAEFAPPLLARAAALRQAIVAAGVSKYNVGGGSGSETFAAAGGRTKVLVPGQVIDDASVLRGGGGVRSNLDLLRAVRGARPNAFVVYKPHPDVEAGIRAGAAPRELVLQFADAIADHGSMPELLTYADELHTLTSLAGFEALLRGVPVHTYGLPFYAGWGITADAERCDRRTRRLDLDELVAGVLILYPRYVHRGSEWPCEAEDVVAELAFLRLRRNTEALIARNRTATLLSQLVRRRRG